MRSCFLLGFSLIRSLIGITTNFFVSVYCWNIFSSSASNDRIFLLAHSDVLMPPK